MSSKHYFIYTFGCAMNEYDTERIAASLEARGYIPSDTVDDSLATLGYYQDEMTIGDVKGEIFYFTSNGIVNSLLWRTKEVDETSINNVLEELRERYGEESAFDQERNSYSWSECEESSIWAAIDGEELKINWISLL